jgi:hypothetical protein
MNTANGNSSKALFAKIVMSPQKCNRQVEMAKYCLKIKQAKFDWIFRGCFSNDEVTVFIKEDRQTVKVPVVADRNLYNFHGCRG